MAVAYKPVWKCIYCGSREGVLSKEHIVPFGLGGDRILPRASCEDCREKTRKIEEFCLRNHLGNTRMALGVQTRHPKERPTEVRFEVSEGDGSTRVEKWPIERLPVFLVMPVYPAAKRLHDLWDGPLNPPNGTEWLYISDQEALKEISGDGGAVKIGSVDFNTFAKLLAKIAHGFLVCELGIDNFQPLVTELVLGKTDEYWPWVGGTVDWLIPEPTEDLIQVHSYHHKSGYVVVRIRIFPNLGAPTYHVVAGKIY